MHDSLLNKLRNTLSKMELALGTINEAIVLVDCIGNIEWCNKTFDNLVGYTHIEVLGKNIAEFLLLQQNGKKIIWKKLLEREIVTDIERNPNVVSNDIYECHVNEQKNYMEVNFKHLALDNRMTVVVVLKDVTREQNYLYALIKKDELLQQQADMLAREKAYVENIIGSMSNMLIVVDRAGVIKTVNQAASLMLGYEREELIGKKVQSLSVSNNKILEDIISLKSVANLEVGCKEKNGNVKPTLLSGSVMFDSDGQISAIVTIAQDISERKEMENRLLYLSTHDSLTNLPNRAYFEETLEMALHSLKRNHQNLALLYLDLDHFKNVNDTFGHRIGDILLVEVAHRIKKSIRQDDLAVRLGGDEFAIILNNLKNPMDVTQVAEKLLEHISDDYELDGNEIKISASIGVAFVNPHQNMSALDLRKNADLAMYKAKAQGRNTYQYYDEKLE